MDQSQTLAVPGSLHESNQLAEFIQTRHGGDAAMKLSGQISSGQVTDMQNYQSGLTPANIRASARREVAQADDQRSSSFDGMMRSGGMVVPVRTQSISGYQLPHGSSSGAINQQPRAAEQVAYLLKQVQRNKGKVFIPLDAFTASTNATTKEATILKESKHPDRVENGNYVFSH